MRGKPEPMPTLTALQEEGLRPANLEDALEFASLEDPELRTQRALLRLQRHLDRGAESSASSSPDRKRRRPRRRTRS